MNPNTQREYSRSDILEMRRDYNAAKIPLRHRNWLERDNTSTEWRAQFDMLLTATETPGSMFCLIGQRGTGKTQMAVSLLGAATRAGQTCLYCKAMDFFTDLKDSYSEKSATSKQVFLKYRAPTLLVIDEIQVRSESAWENQSFTHLIDQRYDALKTTILIGNLKPETLAASLGESIYSRMTETGGIVVCDWPSFRALEKGGRG